MSSCVAGAWAIEPEPHEDARGRFMRAWCIREFAEHGIEFTPLQANMGLSLRKGTIRGLHYQQAPALEAKLVRCTRGAIFDVVVDLRPDSTTYRRWYGDYAQRSKCLDALRSRGLCTWMPIPGRRHRDPLHGFGHVLTGTCPRRPFRRSGPGHQLAPARIGHLGPGSQLAADQGRTRSGAHVATRAGSGVNIQRYGESATALTDAPFLILDDVEQRH